MLESVKSGLLKRRSGSTGSTALRSMAMKAASMTRPAAYMPMMAGEPQAERRAAERGGHEQQDEGHRQRGDAGLVDDGLARRVLEVEEAADAEEGEDADGQRDEEEVAPAPVVGDEAADERAEDRGEAEDATHEALVLAALTRRDDVADDRLRERHQRAHAGALDGAGRDEPPEVLGEAGQDRAGHEDDEAAEVEAAPAVEVAHLADDRHGDRADEHGGGGEPRVVVDAAELGDDARHRRPDDRLADRRDEHAEHERDEDVAGRAVEAGGLRGASRAVCGRGAGRGVRGYPLGRLWHAGNGTPIVQSLQNCSPCTDRAHHGAHEHGPADRRVVRPA